MDGKREGDETGMKTLIRTRTEQLLSREYVLDTAELNGKGTLWTVRKDLKGPHIKIMAYRNCVAVCTSQDLSAGVRRLLENKSRDEIFECPFVYGQTIHYIPGSDPVGSLREPAGRQCEFLFEKEILTLTGLVGFENSLSFDRNGNTSTKAVYVARADGKIIGAAGAAAETCVDGLWEAGVDVVEEYRNGGLGTYLVSRLTQELLRREIVPFYSASVTNIGSQMVAARCGYIPAWVDTFGTILDGSSAYERIVGALSL